MDKGTTKMYIELTVYPFWKRLPALYFAPPVPGPWFPQFELLGPVHGARFPVPEGPEDDCNWKTFLMVWDCCWMDAAAREVVWRI
jgi:hypothetical protein